MRLQISCWLGLLSIFFSSHSSFAQVTPVEAERLGLEIAWRAQAQVPKVGRGIVSAQLWIEGSQPRKYAVVELPGRTIRVSADEIDRQGQPIGIEAAKKLATVQAEHFLRETEGFQVTEVTVPRIRLVIVTNEGLVQAVDAETGAPLWEQSAVCGNSSEPAHPAALSSAGISVVQGRNLYLIDWETGKQLMRKELRHGCANAVVACNDIAFVADVIGRLSAHGLGVERAPWIARMLGRPVGTPVTLADQSLCAIASSDGYVYTLAGGESPSQWTRYETSANISGSLATGNGAFYVGTTSGILSKVGVTDRLGKIVWEFRTGSPITNPALVIGKQVYFANETGSLHAIEDETGFANWSQSRFRVEQPLAEAAGNVLCTTTSQELLALSALDGRFVARTSPLSLRAAVTNPSTDRLYLIGEDGRMQCLRPRNSVMPKLITPVITTEQPPAEEAPVTEQPSPTPSAADPFDFGSEGTATNPMEGGQAETPAQESNPFGNSDLPF